MASQTQHIRTMHESIRQRPETQRKAHAIALLLVLVFLGELVFTVHRQSLTWDEGDHIYAGYESWRAGDFGINPEHPPLLKELATLPLLAMHLTAPQRTSPVFSKNEAYFNGRSLIYNNGGLEAANRIIFRARMMAAIFSIALATVVYLAALELFGSTAALFSLALVVFEPNLIAHGAYVTTDMAVTFGIFSTVYALYRFRVRPSLARLVTVGAAAGIALALKHSAVLLLPITLGLLVVDLIRPRATEQRMQVLRIYAAAVAAAVVIGLPILWATYRFRFSAHPDGGMQPGLGAYMSTLHGLEPSVYALLARWHILPESYLYGMVDIRVQSVAGQSFPTFLFGQVHAHGVPYYFPAAFVIKSTLGFMLLLLVAAYAVVCRRLAGWQRLSFLAVPPLVYLLIAINTGLNIGARHILPMYPFLAVLIGGAAVSLWRVRRAWIFVTLLLLGWHVVSATRSAPNYLAYSNELFGGPANTHKYLTDSNTDWGQQLISVRKYLDQHDIHDCWFGYFVQPSIDYHAYGIPCRPLPTANSMWTDQQVDVPASISGTVLVSAATLTGYEFGSSILSPFQPFMNVRPVDTIDDGVFVYRGTFNTSLSSAFGYFTRATRALAANQPEAALHAAEQAVAINPDLMQGQVILGDTLAALHRDRESAVAYNKALVIAQRMEPSAKADWISTLHTKLSALHL
ncbi:glycosyltransferase family 39 protein [Acidipila sp. EB88]|uniref:ArnT family glycosyltransferase n=1 Tax=Acidipila sp. EB88 TaxID=2305226 RepID=UPI0013151BA0|nr:phospholipid carrier-dependent glycosyltransferase [Acidipila sp. EB88]